MSASTGFDERYASAQLDRRGNAVRTHVKNFYLRRILKHVRGATIDIGCGAGQLLEQLPAGSLGLEVNPVLVDALRRRGLDVRQIVGDGTSISLGSVPASVAHTAILSHVLEHFDDAAGVLRRLMRDCVALGITRLIVVVPGKVGYASDATHKTFVTVDYLRDQGLLEGPGFAVAHRSFFPGNASFIGNLFRYHELMVVYDLHPSGHDGTGE